MATTSTQIMERARRQIEDYGPAYRIRDAEVWGFIDEAQREIAKIRPDAVIQNSEVVPIAALTAITTSGQTLEISDTFRNALVEYVCYRCMMKRANYADVNRAQIHLARFKDFLLN